MSSGHEASGKLIMVCGAARTGTTMLDLMLGNADDAFSTGEIWAYFRPHRQHHFNPVCTCGDPQCSSWEGLLDIPESEFHAAVLQRPEVRFLVDSSKDLRWVLDSNQWAEQHGIECSNVLLWKDPIDLAHSHWKRSGDIKLYRRSFTNYYERFLNLGLPFIAVNYDELAGQTEQVLAALCERLGISYQQGRERFWEKRHHHFFGSAGTAKQVEQGGSAVQNARDFPPEFNAAFKAEAEWIKANSRLNEVLEALRAHDYSRSDVRVSGDTSHKGLKPLWYYRHALKSAWRRRFPETMPVVE